MKIIGGIVSYEDGIKTVQGDQFSPTRKVRVELNFSLDDADEGEDTHILRVLNKAQSMVQEKLGIHNPTAAAEKVVTETSPKPKAAEKSVADQHEEHVASIAASSKATAKVVSDKERLAQEAFSSAGKVAAEMEEKLAAINDPVVIEEDPLADLMGTAPTPVTDAELNAAVQTKNKEIKDPVRIRNLIAEYNGGPGKVLADIEQEQRQEFLAKLKAFKAT